MESHTSSVIHAFLGAVVVTQRLEKDQRAKVTSASFPCSADQLSGSGGTHCQSTATTCRTESRFSMALWGLVGCFPHRASSRASGATGGEHIVLFRGDGFFP